MALTRLQAILASLSCNQLEQTPYAEEKLAVHAAENPRRTTKIANNVAEL